MTKPKGTKMTEPKHTIGPWKLSEHYPTCVYDETGWKVTEGDIHWRENWKAEVRLIAAAPELLAALMKMTKDFCDGCPDYDNGCREGKYCKYMSQFQKVIAKACGEEIP